MSYLILFLVRQVLVFISWCRSKPASWWEARMRHRPKPRMIAEFLARQMKVGLSNELKMNFWRSYRLRGFPDEDKQPDAHVSLCILFGEALTQRQMQFFENLNADRVVIFIDRTMAHDASRCISGMKLSPRLRYLVLTEQELAAQLAQAKLPRLQLSEMIDRAGAGVARRSDWNRSQVTT